VPLIFYEDSTLEKRNYFPHKELRLQVTDKQSIVQSKFVKGFYWLAEYKFNKTTLKKFFIKKVRERVVSYGGTVTFHDSDFVHCSIPMDDKLYWASITYNKDKYLVKIVENKNIKLIRLNNEKKNNRYKWHKMIPKVLGYRVDSSQSIYQRYTKKRIDKWELEGEYWFLRFKQKNHTDSVPKSDLLVGFKNELRRVGGEKIKEDESMILFKVDDTYGRFRVSTNSFSIEMLDKGKFKQTIRVEDLDNSNIKLYGLLFASGKATLSHDKGTEVTLLKIQNMMEESKDLVIEIQGHTDNTGNKEENQKLSLARAEALKEALIKRGIEASRLQTKGFGQSKPIGNNAVEEGRAKNRRVELMKIKGKISLDIKHFPPLDGYERKVVAFENATISDKSGFRVQGREVRGQYNLTRQKSSFSTLEIMKNYESIVKQLHGKIVSRRKDKLYFLFDEDIAGRLSVFDGYYYISLIYKKGAKK
jgi:outer membrane protein OmpA-like peptidoglycan-associated protein